MNIDPRIWSASQLESDAAEAKIIFRSERLDEPAEVYNRLFEEQLAASLSDIELLDSPDGLSLLIRKLVATGKTRDRLRALIGPPVSEDDLDTLLDKPKTWRKNANRPELINDLIELIQRGLDVNRYPWLTQNRAPSDVERFASACATAALIAARKTATSRRSESTKRQEEAVAQALVEAGLTGVKKRPIKGYSDLLSPGEFCRETLVVSDKADFAATLLDRRPLLIECKVSNTTINSQKRLNKEAVKKADAWRSQFGRQAVVAVVLAGVFDPAKVLEAQPSVTVWWSHRLSDLVEFVRTAKP